MAGGASGAPASTAQGAADAGVFQAPSIVDAPLDGGSAAGDGTEAGAVTSQQDAGSPGSGDGGIFADPFAAHNVAVINQYRAGANLPPYVLDSTLSAFALAGAVELSMDHMPHQHFINAEAMGTLFIPASGFRTAAGENQGDPNGWRITSTDPTTNELTQIDQIQAQMYAEGPTGGHYQNMMSTKFTRIGIGLLEVANQLYLCNDFSN